MTTATTPSRGTSPSPPEVVNEIRMHATNRLIVLVVEGPTDSKAIGEHIDRNHVRLVETGGRIAALEVANLLAGVASSFARVLVDRDFSEPSAPASVLLVTNARDLDAELLSLPGVLDRVYLGMSGHSFRSATDRLEDLVCSTVAPSTAVRAICTRLGLGVPQDGLVIPPNGGMPVAQIAARKMAHRSREAGLTLDSDWWLTQIENEMGGLGGLADHRGHDLHVALARLASGSHTQRRVQSMVWIAVRTEDFIASPLGKELSNWAAGVSASLWRLAISAGVAA